MIPGNTHKVKSTEISKIAVIGLGYVGLPLALLAADKKFEVIGIDVDSKKIDSLKNGKSYIDDITDKQVQTTKATFYDDASQSKEADAVIICVPTPVTDEKMPDLGPVRGAVSAVAPHLKEGSLVVIESTINPGVCDEIVIPLLEEKSGKKVGIDILLAHCPERINPGDPLYNVSNINRVVGANSDKELDVAVRLYQQLIDAEIKPMATIKEVEAVKVIENSFRDINIAFVNELAMSFHKLGINLENVIDGASTKPFSFMPHRPGCGVGGHCIPVDPYYLIEYAHGYGFEHDFLRLARTINESMPQYTVDLVAEVLNKLGKSLKNTKVTLLGLAYKPNVKDSRESPATTIRRLLEKAGVELSVYDPYLKEESTVSTLEEALDGATVLVIATGHSEFKNIADLPLDKYGTKAIVDGRNLLKYSTNKISETGVIYQGIGI